MYFKEFLVSHFDCVCFVSFLFQIFRKSGIILENIFNVCVCVCVCVCTCAHAHTHTQNNRRYNNVRFNLFVST